MRLALSRCARLALSRCAPLRLASYPALLLRLRCVPPVPAPCGAVACLAKHAKGGKGKGKGKGKAAKQDEEEQPVEGAVLAVPPLAVAGSAGCAAQLGTRRSVAQGQWEGCGAAGSRSGPVAVRASGAARRRGLCPRPLRAAARPTS